MHLTCKFQRLSLRKFINSSSFLFSPLLLVSTIDGAVHALNAQSGDSVWSFGTESPLLRSSKVVLPDVFSNGVNRTARALAARDAQSRDLRYLRRLRPPSLITDDVHVFDRPNLDDDDNDNFDSDNDRDENPADSDSAQFISMIPGTDGGLYIGRVHSETGKTNVEVSYFPSPPPGHSHICHVIPCFTSATTHQCARDRGGFSVSNRRWHPSDRGQRDAATSHRSSHRTRASGKGSSRSSHHHHPAPAPAHTSLTHPRRSVSR